ncbi:MAG: FG-GAP repeat protein, partial [Acidobacteria bacterium]|nr:FG-GAP repeat protein [Acidobacteriota bacterium]
MSANANYGFAVAMGYLNGDEFADLAVGAPAEGKVYIYFGSLTDNGPGEAPFTRAVPASPADVILSAPAVSRFGFSVAIGRRTPPDSDDTANPLIVGAPAIGAVPASAGAAYVVAGGSLAPGGVLVPPLDPEDPLPAGCTTLPSWTCDVTAATEVVILSGVLDGSETGYSVGIGPVLAAGSDDFVVGARRAQNGSGVATGAVYVVPETAADTVLSADSVRKIYGHVPASLTATTPMPGLGESVTIADFFDDAGTEELAIGAVGTSPSDSTTNPNPPGRVYILNVPASVDGSNVANVDAAGGVYRVRGHSNNDFFGFSLTAGDFDGDGAADLAVGAIYADHKTSETDCANGTDLKNAGAVYVFKSTDLVDPLLLADPAGDVGTDPDANSRSSRSIWGRRQWDELGFSLASGDVNDDGIDDLLAGARWHDRSLSDINQVDEGSVYALYGGGNAFDALPEDPDAPLPPGVWPQCLDCYVSGTATADPSCASNPAGVGAMLFGGDYSSSSSEEIGFSLAVGDFNQDSVYDDIAVASITHERVYLVTLNDQDSDGHRDIRDADDDNDGVLDGADSAPLDPDVCIDSDGDTCDDCAVGTDNFGPLPDNTPLNDGTDTDGAGQGHAGDPDDDNAGVLDASDTSSLNPDVCADSDGDTCD